MTTLSTEEHLYRMGRKLFVCVLIMSLCTLAEEKKVSLVFLDQQRHRKEHFLVTWGAWQCLSGLGVFGTISNSFLLYVFYSERKLMATSVNALICMETMYRLAYTIIIHWRTYNLVHNTTLFNEWLGLEMVN